MRVRAIATPGHTYTHLSYALETARRRAPVGGVHRRVAAVRGHRPPGPARPEHTARPGPPPVRLGAPAGRPSCPTTPRSARRTGSAASARPPRPSGTASTHRPEKRQNPALTQDEDRSSPSPSPAWTPTRPTTRTWPRPTASARPPRTCPLAAARRQGRSRHPIAAGEWVVDLRSRTAFAAGHVAGTLNFGLHGQFATYLGWLIPWGTPVTLLGETADQVAEAQRELVRIGIDRPAGAATGTPGRVGRRAPLRRFPPAEFADLAQVRHPGRSSSSTCAATTSAPTGHIDGAVHIPLHELLARARRRPGRRGLGALRRRLPRLGRRLRPGRSRLSPSSPSTTASTTTRPPQGCAHEQTGTECAILTATREREDVRLQRLALPAARLILGLQAWKLHRFEVFQRGRLVSPPADIRKILDLGLLDQFKGHEGTVG